MKVLVVTTIFAVLSGASAGSAVAWPGARVLSTQPTAYAAHQTLVPAHTKVFGAHQAVVPAHTKAYTAHQTVVPQTKFFGFSTTQYINSVPSAVPISLQPQVHYQVPQLSHFAPVQHTAFYPIPAGIAGGSYYPSHVFYPPFAVAPSAPGFPGTQIIPAPQPPAHDIPSFPQEYPSQGSPSFPPQGAPGSPSQTAGDADTAVVDSADYPQQPSQDQPQDQPQDQRQDQPQESSPSTEAPQQDQPTAPQFPPADNFPSLPQAPSFPPSFPQFPQGSIPQFPQGVNPAFPSFPQFPQGVGQPVFPSLPQYPQGSLPPFPQLPQFPSNPNFPQSPSPAPPTSFPADAGGDRGLNDEDTISVESA